MRILRTGAQSVATIAMATCAVGSVLTSPAWAAKKPTITCTSLNGNLGANTATLSGCGGNTGGSGSFPPTAFATGSGTIAWSNGTSTSVAISFKQLKKAKGCPSAAYSEYKAKGATTADTTGSVPPGSKIKGNACVDVATGSMVGDGTFQI